MTLAAVLIALLLPSLGWFIDSRNNATVAEVTVIRERQNEVLQRLAAIELQLRLTSEWVQQLQVDLHEHEQNSR